MVFVKKKYFNSKQRALLANCPNVYTVSSELCSLTEMEKKLDVGRIYFVVIPLTDAIVPCRLEFA